MQEIKPDHSRIDIKTLCELIAAAASKTKPVSRSTAYRLEKLGKIPKRLQTPLSSPVWDRAEVLKALGL